jgi:hypothetical protein
MSLLIALCVYITGCFTALLIQHYKFKHLDATFLISWFCVVIELLYTLCTKINLYLFKINKKLYENESTTKH